MLGQLEYSYKYIIYIYNIIGSFEPENRQQTNDEAKNETLARETPREVGKEMGERRRKSVQRKGQVGIECGRVTPLVLATVGKRQRAWVNPCPDEAHFGCAVPLLFA